MNSWELFENKDGKPRVKCSFANATLLIDWRQHLVLSVVHEMYFYEWELFSIEEQYLILVFRQYHTIIKPNRRNTGSRF